MRVFRDAPIRTKLSLIVLAVIFTAMLFSSSILFFHDITSIKPAVAAEMTARADLVGANCAAALRSQRPDAAAEVLKWLRVDPSVTHACIFDQAGKVFAVYRSDAEQEEAIPITQRVGHSFNAEGNLEVYQPILHDRSVIGSVYFHVTMDRHFAPIWFRGMRRLVVMACALAVALFLATFLHRAVSGPIARLAQATRTIAAHDDFALRVQGSKGDVPWERAISGGRLKCCWSRTTSATQN